MSDSEQVRIRFNMPKPGVARGTEVEVELTPYVQGLLDHGIASLISGAVDVLCAETSDTSTGGPAASPAEPTEPAAPDDPAAGAPIGTSRRKAADAALRAAAAQDEPTATPPPVEPGGVQQPPAGAD